MHTNAPHEPRATHGVSAGNRESLEGGGAVPHRDRRPIAAQVGQLAALVHSNRERPVASSAVALEAGLSAKPTVQRNEAWTAKHPDATLNRFVTALDVAVQQGAAEALTPDRLTGADGYTELWKASATLIITPPEELEAEDRAAAKNARHFAAARYGYAVEAYANSQTASLQSALPQGYTFAIQAQRGMTRPDFIVFDAAGREVGWFDVTSANSLGHIFRKAGGNWRNRSYVAEVTYPPLNTDDIRFSDQSIGVGVRRRNAARRVRQAWAAHVADYQNRFHAEYRRFSTLAGNPVAKDKKRTATKDAFTLVFPGEDITDGSAKNLLRALGEDVRPYGFAGGGVAKQGDVILRKFME